MIKSSGFLSFFLLLEVRSGGVLGEQTPLISKGQMQEAGRLFSGLWRRGLLSNPCRAGLRHRQRQAGISSPLGGQRQYQRGDQGDGAITLDEVLETVPGLHVYNFPSHNYQAPWSIRGIHTGTNPQVVLLLNGRAIQDAHQRGSNQVLASGNHDLAG